MIFSKTCDYGLQALFYIALQDKRKYVTVREVSDNLNISFHFLAKILHSLAQSQIIISHRGSHGGVALARSSDKITLMEIVTALGESKIFSECVFGFDNCNQQNPCCLHDYWGSTQVHLNSVFRQTCLSDVVSKIRANQFFYFKFCPSFLQEQKP